MIMLDMIKKYIKLLLSPFTSLYYHYVGFDWLKVKVGKYSLKTKTEVIAVFTQTYNEGELLLYWEKYYGKIVGYKNLFIINNGGNDGSCKLLNPLTNVINMPGGAVDLDNLANLNGYLQRFLLLNYKWVLKADVDEFLLFKGGLLRKLKNLPDGIYSPEKAYAVVHDKYEKDFDYNLQITSQRKCFVKEIELLKKPSLCSKPSSWDAGNHHTKEKTFTLNEMYMIHLRFVDFERLYKRNLRWSSMKPSLSSKTLTKAFDLAKYTKKEIHELTNKEILSYQNREKINLPKWVYNYI